MGFRRLSRGALFRRGRCPARARWGRRRCGDARASVSLGGGACALPEARAATMWRCRCASLPSESVGGVFGTAWAPAGALCRAWMHCWRGRRLFGAVGCPPFFFCGFFVQPPGRSRTAARPVRGAAEACAFRRRASCPQACSPCCQIGVLSVPAQTNEHLRICQDSTASL